MFEESKEDGTISVKSMESVMNLEWYSKPIYNWELTQVSDQIYEAVKV